MLALYSAVGVTVYRTSLMSHDRHLQMRRRDRPAGGLHERRVISIRRSAATHRGDRDLFLRRSLTVRSGRLCNRSATANEEQV